MTFFNDIFEWSSNFFFLQIFALIFCLSSWVIGVQNPIHSILLLILVFFWGSFFLFLLQMEYFALLFMIVYVGAIVVLFLFIIMMLELKLINTTERFFDWISYKNFFFLFIIFEILFFLNEDLLENLFFFFNQDSFSMSSISQNNVLTSFWWHFYETNQNIQYSYIIQRIDQLRGIGQILFMEYGWSVLLAAIILLLSMIGSVVLTLETNIYSELKIQDVNYQSWRNSNFAQNSLRILKRYSTIEVFEVSMPAPIIIKKKINVFFS